MTGTQTLLAACLGYVALLFAVAFWAERRAARGRAPWLGAPLVYTLSLSIYCTAWTFYGAVGTAARGGLEYLPIYLGPTLVFLGWRFLPRKLVRIGQSQRITSIADLISSRYGKSPALGVAVTLLAVAGSTPYIALQLKSVTLSFAAFAAAEGAAPPRPELAALIVAAGLAAFTILFGARGVDADERHHGVVSAIAIEALVKLCALIGVGVFVVWGLFPGPAAVFAARPEVPAALLEAQAVLTPRWVTLMAVSACAVICLPRMFQVMVVENTDPRHLATAGWAFPLYLALMSLFVLPIAVAGLATAPPGADPDLFVLALPLAAGRQDLALLAFLGGFSAATSMVIVAAIALSTMISNHIITPFWLRRGGDLRGRLLWSRRLSIAGVLALGYAYFLVSAPEALAAIGLVSFAGIAQLAPALIGALYWRGATRAGALAGIGAGFAVWAYALFLPSFEGGFLLSAETIANGPFGLTLLRPQALFGLEGQDPLVHAVFWSLGANVAAFVGVSLAAEPRPLEQLQAAQFVDVYRSGPAPALYARSATAGDLLTLAARILGPGPAQAHFAAAARAQGGTQDGAGLPEPSDAFIAGLERELAGAVGAASAHALVSQTAGRGAVSVEGLMRIADEAQQLVEAKRRLERQSRELEEAAAQLRHANDQLKRVDALKDAFLSQVSHELRTPMTSIRSFAEILGDMEEIDGPTARRFLGIIREESQRLTRLLDEILDLSFLESGRAAFHIAPVRLAEVADRALASSEGLLTAAGVPVTRAYAGSQAVVETDFDRVAQVVINLISNAVKYGRGPAPGITISLAETPQAVHLEVADRGPGIPEAARDQIFEKFARLGEADRAGSAGLGLPIAREIMRNLGGDLVALPNAPGATFRVVLPRRAAGRAAAE